MAAVVISDLCTLICAIEKEHLCKVDYAIDSLFNICIV